MDNRWKPTCPECGVKLFFRCIHACCTTCCSQCGIRSSRMEASLQGRMGMESLSHSGGLSTAVHSNIHSRVVEKRRLVDTTDPSARKKGKPTCPECGVNLFIYCVHARCTTCCSQCGNPSGEMEARLQGRRGMESFLPSGGLSTAGHPNIHSRVIENRPLVDTNDPPARKKGTSEGRFKCRDCNRDAKQDCGFDLCRGCCNKKRNECETHVYSTYGQQAHGSGSTHESAGTSGTRIRCRHCEKDALKGCIFVLCRTCCIKDGNPCINHKQSTWVPYPKHP